MICNKFKIGWKKRQKYQLLSTAKCIRAVGLFFVFINGN